MIAPEMPSEPGTFSTSAIDIVPVQEAFSLFPRRSPKTGRPRIQAKLYRSHGHCPPSADAALDRLEFGPFVSGGGLGGVPDRAAVTIPDILRPLVFR